MQHTFFGLFLFFCFTARAQYDTVIGYWIQGESEMISHYSFQKPTVLVFEFRNFYYTPNGEKWPTAGKRYYHYSKGKANGVYYTMINGQLTDSGCYKNGLKEGLFKSWYFPSGHLKVEEHFKNGKLDGIYRSWSDDCWLASYTEYLNGERCGSSICYFSNGRKAIEYKAGNDTIFYWYFSGEPLLYLTKNSMKYFNSFEENFGMGVIVTEYKNITCPIYDHPHDSVPLRYASGAIATLKECRNNHIQFHVDIGAIYLKDSSGWSELLIMPIYEERCDDFATYKVWVKSECISSFYTPWEQYLVGKKLRYETVRVLPDDSSRFCKFLPFHCLEVKAVVGDWVLVVASDNGSDECNDTTDCAEEGWVRWRDKERIIVEFRK